MAKKQNFRKNSKQDKRAAYRRGHIAEHFAALYLRLIGYKILRMRYRSPFGEVDIIAHKNNVLTLIEVKQRTNLANAINAVTPTAQTRIARAGQHYLSSFPKMANFGLRYDIIAITGFRIHHLRDAWRD